ncbi:MAG: anti-sigma factor family protein [Myxococcales bacterium]
MTRSLADEMACIELVELVTEFLEGALSPEDRERFEKHVALCKGCAAYLLQMRKTIEASRALRGEDLSHMAKERLLGAFRGLFK